MQLYDPGLFLHIAPPSQDTLSHSSISGHRKHWHNNFSKSVTKGSKSSVSKLVNIIAWDTECEPICWLAKLSPLRRDSVSRSLCGCVTEPNCLPSNMRNLPSSQPIFASKFYKFNQFSCIHISNWFLCQISSCIADCSQLGGCFFLSLLVIVNKLNCWYVVSMWSVCCWYVVGTWSVCRR